MSMIMQYARLRPSELAELQRLLAEAPDDAHDFVSDLARQMDTDKAWAGLEHLLKKLDPPVDVISGGTALTDDEWGYESPRLLTRDEVGSAARFLGGTPFERLVEGYDPAEFAAARVYPGIWDEEWAQDYLSGAYAHLVTFFRAAAAAGDSIVLWMS
ncbi:hypothetical protein GCM10010399_83740 [Dactylosporangium fulvum]|uniref:YfbM family protein n=1 Tax=Dactylosporangium fulvum TaxID=53359 RepID=A0ABY5VPQ1_9ACTN|nr:YfbM family protein [Dactylosporangium fulvum]UWP79084.1 YfbM family protein [Dactylosporangium fulvum]